MPRRGLVLEEGRQQAGAPEQPQGPQPGPEVLQASRARCWGCALMRFPAFSLPERCPAARASSGFGQALGFAKHLAWPASSSRPPDDVVAIQHPAAPAATQWGHVGSVGAGAPCPCGSSRHRAGGHGEATTRGQAVHEPYLSAEGIFNPLEMASSGFQGNSAKVITAMETLSLA